MANLERIKKNIERFNQDLDEIEELLSNWKRKKRNAENPNEESRCNTEIEKLEKEEEEIENKIAELEEKLNSNSANQDEYFELLCGIDFKAQENQFKSFLKHRNFATFVIRSEDCYEQRWVIRQLVENFSHNNEVYTFDFSPGIGLSELLDDMKKNYNVEFKKNTTVHKCERIRTSLLKKLEGHNQFIILRNSFEFTHPAKTSVSDKFNEIDDFVEHFVDELNLELQPNIKSNKIIIFFVENNLEHYNLKCNTITCKFFEKAENIHSNFYNEWQNDPEKLFFIGFEPIPNIDNNLLTTWKNNNLNSEILKAFENKDIDEFIEENKNGNPDTIILALSKILNYNNPWKSY